jgi:hypothetical protein
MRRAAGFHADQAGRRLGEKRKKTITPQLARDRPPILAEKRVNLKIPLAQIDPDSDKLY